MGTFKKTEYNPIRSHISFFNHQSSIIPQFQFVLVKGQRQPSDRHGRQLDCLDRCHNNPLTSTSKIFILSAESLSLICDKSMMSSDESLYKI